MLVIFGTVIYPVFFLFQLSLSDVKFQQGQLVPAFAGLNNFQTLMSDPGFLNASHRTFLFAGFSVPISLLLGLLVALALTRLFYSRLAPLVERVFWGLAKAPEAFPDGAAFYSFEAVQLAIGAVMLISAGGLLILAWRRVRFRGWPLWQILAPALIALDLLVATWGFNPAADPDLLPDRVKPELIAFLESQPGL